MKTPKHPSTNKLEYHRITPYIFIGTNMCCQAHFDATLLRRGIRADISLEQERLDSPFGVTTFLWLPTKDHTPPTQTQLTVGVHALQTLIHQKVKSYVHCKNGHGRAPTLVAAYLITQGETVDRAIAYIKKRRPTIHLEKSQKRALVQFAKKMEKNNLKFSTHNFQSITNASIFQ